MKKFPCSQYESLHICFEHHFIQISPNLVIVGKSGKKLDQVASPKSCSVSIQSKKSKKCIVPNCKNETGIFHQFPSDETKRRIWLSLLGMQEYEFTGSWKQIRICQAHFTPESYDGQNLKKDAYPTLNVPCPLIPMCGKKGLQVGFLKFGMNETCLQTSTNINVRLMSSGQPYPY